MMSEGRLAFLDTETTGLDPVTHEVWEVALILPDGEYQGDYVWQLPVDLGKADPMALAIGRWHERRWSLHSADSYVSDLQRRTEEALRGRGSFVVPANRMDEWASWFAELTNGRHLVGAVVSFDEKRLERLLRKHHACPTWHYHLIDCEALAAGWLAQSQALLNRRDRPEVHSCPPSPPWDSNALSRAVGVDPGEFDRHTALGDARWARAIYEKVMGDA